MKLFDTKVAGDKVELKGEIDEKLNVVLSQVVSLEPLLIPALQKIKDIIPGHFDDALIDAAIPKLEAYLAGQAAPSA